MVKGKAKMKEEIKAAKQKRVEQEEKEKREEEERRLEQKRKEEDFSSKFIKFNYNIYRTT